MSNSLKLAGLGLAAILLSAQAQASTQTPRPAATAQPAPAAQVAPAAQPAATTTPAPTQAAHPTQTADAVDPGEDPNRLICRSIAETGSLVRRKRQCFTRAQWDRINEGGRNQALYVTGAIPQATSN